MLKEKLMEELKEAMKNKDTIKKNTVQMVRAAILQIEKDKGIEVGDDKILEIIAKEVKTKKDALVDFEKAMNEGNVSSNRCSLFKLRKNDKLELMKINIDILLKLGKTEDAQAYMNKLVIEFQDLGDELLMLHSDLALKTDDIKKAVNLLRKIGDKDEKLFKKYVIKSYILPHFCFILPPNKHHQDQSKEGKGAE